MAARIMLVTGKNIGENALVFFLNERNSKAQCMFESA
jgi:hypothetical protein